MRILIIDDDPEIVEIYQVALSDLGYAVDNALTGEEGLGLAISIRYDVIILDVVLPGKNGLQICKELRAQNIDTPVIMISGIIHDEQTIIEGLDSGAIQYLIKPVAPSKLSALVRAILRHGHSGIKSQMQIGKVVIDMTTQRIWVGAEEVSLTKKEYALLEYLVYHRNMIITRTELELHVWNMNMDCSSNIVDAHIKNLRDKLGIENQGLIETIWGKGYRLKMI